MELDWKTSVNLGKVPNFRRANFHGLRESLASADITLASDVNESLDNFTSSLKNAELEHIPRKSRRETVTQPKYWDREAQLLHSEKRSKYSLAKSNRSRAAEEEFKSSRRTLKKTLRRKKWEYEN